MCAAAAGGRDQAPCCRARGVAGACLSWCGGGGGAVTTQAAEMCALTFARQIIGSVDYRACNEPSRNFHTVKLREGLLQALD